MAEYIGQILHIKPNYIVSIPEFDTPKRYFTAARVKNHENLKNNRHKSVLSPKAINRVKSAINWLVASAKEKTIRSPKTGKNYNFKVNLITLTLPDTKAEITEYQFKKKLLHPFLVYLKKYHQLNNYVWKVEFQENGKLHVHITTDTYIHHSKVRKIWNRLLESNAFLDDFKKKFLNCSFESYLSLISENDKRSKAAKKKSWIYGTKTGWTQPNSTDIHAVWKVKNLAAYLAKYLSKNEQNDNPITGRIWGCSYELSTKNACRVGVHRDEAHEVMNCLMNQNIEYKVIQSQDKITNRVFTQAEIFFIKQSDWNLIIHPKIRKAYDNHRFNIRNGIIEPPDDLFYLTHEKITNQTEIHEPIKQKIQEFEQMALDYS